MSDLFGNPDRMESGSAPAIAVDLFTAAAEREAYESGRNVNQVRIELAHCYSPEHEILICRACGGTFIAKPRADSTCNLCRRWRMGHQES